MKYRNEIIDGNFANILYCLPPNQNIFVPDFIKNDKIISFAHGIPDFENIDATGGVLVILDDLMSDITIELMDLVIRGSHHRSISVIFLVHNLFYGGNKFFRTISLNMKYIVVMKNPRDKKQISTLASQLSPDNINFIKEAFIDATREAFSYLFVDLSQTCDDRLRVRTNIFSSDCPQNIFYVSVNKN